MSRARLRLSKLGRVKYISHLDLMRTMQRVFIRAGVALRHTEGFNPHPYISFALPLPVGCESVCELMDFDLLDERPLSDIPGVINAFMPQGISAAACYEPQRKFSQLAWVDISGKLYYDGGVPDGAAAELMRYFSREHIVISKKSKRGSAEVDIIPLIKSLKISGADSDTLSLRAYIAAQNPSLNPDHLAAAIGMCAERLAPDLASFRREGVYDGELRIFE